MNTRAIYVRAFVLAVLACSVAGTRAEQGAAASEPAFDVASVKLIDRSTPGGMAASLSQSVRQQLLAMESSITSLTVQPGGRWLVRAATLGSILESVYPAYSRPGLIVGGPAWIDSQYYEIDARAAAGSTPEDIERMAKRLLADRFKLQVSTAMRPVDVYALNVARSDKQFGRGLRPPIACEREPKSIEPGGRPIWANGPRCRLGLGREGDVYLLSGGAAQMSELVTWLQTRVDRPVVDRTGLIETYAIRLELPPVTPADPGTSTSDMITAVREQLGLSLLPRTEQTNVLMIDSVEMPTPN